MLGVNSSAKSGQKSQYWKSLLLKKGAGYDNLCGMERNGSGSGGLVWCGVVGPDVCNCEARHDPRWQECNCEPPHQLSKGGHRHTSTGDWDIVLINCMLSGGRPTDDRIVILFLGKGWNV